MKSKTKGSAKPCYNDQVESYNREKNSMITNKIDT